MIFILYFKYKNSENPNFFKYLSTGTLLKMSTFYNFKIIKVFKFDENY